RSFKQTVPSSPPCQPIAPPFLPGCGGPAIPCADSRNTASICARPSTSTNSSTASFDCSINSTIGSKACPFLARNFANSWLSSLPMMGYGFSTTVLLFEDFPSPILVEPGQRTVAQSSNGSQDTFTSSRPTFNEP